MWTPMDSGNRPKTPILEMQCFRSMRQGGLPLAATAARGFNITGHFLGGGLMNSKFSNWQVPICLFSLHSGHLLRRKKLHHALHLRGVGHLAIWAPRRAELTPVLMFHTVISEHCIVRELLGSPLRLQICDATGLKQQ